MNIDLNYNKLNKETQIFINKAIDIFFTIAKKDLKCGDTSEYYDITMLDKAVLSLFIAGMLVDGDLKKVFLQYDDIKLNDLLEFINTREDEIRTGDLYDDFFDVVFKPVLKDMLTFNYPSNTRFKNITPELMVSKLNHVSNILDYLGNKYLINSIIHSNFFATIDEIIRSKDIIEVNEKKSINRLLDSEWLSPNKSNHDSLEVNEDSNSIKNRDNVDDIKNDENGFWDILDKIQKKFIGQEVVAEELFYNIINNQELAENNDIFDGQRSIIFIDGPTGTGKTAITREITDKLGIPFVTTSLTNYSSTGYVGGQLTDLLKMLYIKSNGDLKKAEKGILVLDEFDKIAYLKRDGLEMKKAVQQQLLDFMGGGKYIINVGNSQNQKNEVEFDTSKLTFVCLGALSELRINKTTKKQTIGFEQVKDLSEVQDYNITPQDLVDIGLEAELVGRFNTYLHTEDYSEESLLGILKESTISPLIGFRKWIESKGKKLVLEEGAYELIAKQAYELKMGARSLQTVMNNIRTHYLKDVLRGESDTIYLDLETIIKVNNQMVNRKGRR